MARLGLTRDTDLGLLIAEPGFDPYERDDGLHPMQGFRARGGKLRYNDYLREHGYDGENSWDSWANSAEGEDGEILSAWNLRYSAHPARVAEEHSETAYMTNRAMDFITEQGYAPWLCHLSFIKPHWPYIAPSPYHAMYTSEHFIDPVRSDAERDDPNPVFGAFMNMEVSQTFSDDEARKTVLTGYMGLVKQIDDHLGRLFAFLDERGLTDETMIVFTSDHGDYLGDHWMGEKELFHECSVRVPLIIADPRSSADSTRGSRSDALVEAIDLVPTFMEAVGAQSADHRLEGRSLMQLLEGDTPQDWRDDVFSEIDYAFYAAREMLDAPASEARGYMIRTDRWKYVYFKGFGCQLFDLEADPHEFTDLGRDPEYAGICTEMHERLTQRLLARKNRVTMTDEKVLASRAGESGSGVIIGRW